MRKVFLHFSNDLHHAIMDHIKRYQVFWAFLPPHLLLRSHIGAWRRELCFPLVFYCFGPNVIFGPNVTLSARGGASYVFHWSSTVLAQMSLLKPGVLRSQGFAFCVWGSVPSVPRVVGPTGFLSETVILNTSDDEPGVGGGGVTLKRFH